MSRWLKQGGVFVPLGGAVPTDDPADALLVEALADAPLFAWTFNESTGTTVTDRTTNGRDGTISGTAARNAVPLIGSRPSTCLHAGYASIADAAWMDITPDMTAEAVFMLSRRLTSSDTAAMVIARYDIGGLFWHLGVLSNGNFSVAVRNASNTYQETTSATVPCPIGRPVHIAMTRTTSTIILFLDGVSVATGTTSGQMLTGASSIWSNKAGTEAGSGAPWERGVLHVGFVAHYASALSSGRVLNHAQAAGLTSA